MPLPVPMPVPVPVPVPVLVFKIMVKVVERVNAIHMYCHYPYITLDE